MNTIKVFLAESGRIAELHKDFPLYQYQYQNKLLNVYVPTSILAPNFITQSEQGHTIGEYVAGTAVKIGMTYLTRSGELKVSQNRYMRYLKTLTYQNVEYALFERKLPKEFTLYAGQGANAPTLIINVVNIETDTDPNSVLSLITSQTCSLDVMSSSSLDNDELIEPSELDAINSRLNAIDAVLPEKQDKEDASINITTDNEGEPTWQDSQTVVGAINNNTSQNSINKANIEQNTQDISQNTSDIQYLYGHIALPEEYIGQMTGSSLPTDAQLTAFVVSTADRQPKNADVVIFVLQVAGGPDKNYKYVYSVDGWNGYEIPPMEQADNGSLGIVEGTYSIGSTNQTIVDIVGGQILNIYVKDGNNDYRNIREYLNTTTENIASIVNGTTSVGVALRAVADQLGNDIVSTYLTQDAGATKHFVRQYALPKQFNDLYYLVAGGILPVNPVDLTPQFTLTVDAVGDFTIFDIYGANSPAATYDLSSKNSATDNIQIVSNRDCTVRFRLSTYARQASGLSWETLGVEITNAINFVANDIQKVEITTLFSYLGDQIFQMNAELAGGAIRQKLEIITDESTPTTFSIYSNHTYPSTFALNTNSLVVYHTAGQLGQQPYFVLMPSGDITALGINFIGSGNAQLYNNVECMVKLRIPANTVGYNEYFVNNLDLPILSAELGGENIRFATPFNFLSGQPTFKQLNQVNHYSDIDGTVYEFKCFIKIEGGNYIFIVDEDKAETGPASQTQAGGVYAWEDENGLHIWLSDPMIVRYDVEQNTQGGETYEITTMNYETEVNASGGLTYTIGE